MLKLRTLGSLDLLGTEGEEISAVLSQPKRLALLVYLAVEPGPHRRDTLLTLFWPERDEARARNALSQSLTYLRQYLSEGTLTGRRSERIGIAVDALWSDVGEFDAAILDGRWAAALDLYAGDFLRGFHVGGAWGFEEWVEEERSRLKRAAAGAAWSLAHEQAERGALVEARQTAEKALGLVCADESPVREFMSALADAGDRAAALGFFESYRDILKKELELEPSPTTMEVAEAIRNGGETDPDVGVKGPEVFPGGSNAAQSSDEAGEGKIDPGAATSRKEVALVGVRVDGESPRDGQGWRDRMGLKGLWVGASAVIAGMSLFTWIVPRACSGPRMDSYATYASLPRLSAWEPRGGFPFIPFFVDVDSFLVAGVGDSIHLFDGGKWHTLSVPEPLRLPLTRGSALDGKLLAWENREAGPVGWLLELTPEGLVKSDSLPTNPDLSVLSSWSDGQDLVTYSNSIHRLTPRGWVREETGTTVRIMLVWGNQVDNRFAIPAGAEDSILAYDGINWEWVDIRPDSTMGTARYTFGASFDEGGTVVLGKACNQVCRPFILQQDTFGQGWREVVISEGLGIPLEQDTAQCSPEAFIFGGGGYEQSVLGMSSSDYYVWGSWSSCDDPGGIPVRKGCPEGHPCVWHVSAKRMRPVEELLGREVLKMALVGDAYYALLSDGTLWRRFEERWRVVGRLPMPDQSTALVAATPTGHFSIGSPVWSFNWWSRGVMWGSHSLPGVSPERPPRQLEAVDSVVVGLRADGVAFASVCRRRELSLPGRKVESWPICSSWDSLPSPSSPLSDVALLPSGEVIGVGADGLAVSWTDRALHIETVPLEAQEDSLWGVVVTDDGTATAIGGHTVLERDPSGNWSVVRRFPSLVSGYGVDFAVASDGDLVVARLHSSDLGGPLNLWVWNGSTEPEDSLPITSLAASSLWTLDVGSVAVHALSDGRLVAGIGFPQRPDLGGWLQVWTPPLRQDHFERVSLPIQLDVTDLDDDGEYLYVAGNTGIFRIPLDSLPFAPGLRR